MIIKVRKTAKKPETVLITSTDSISDFESITKLRVPYDAVVSGEELYVYLPTNEADINVIKKINMYHSTMPDEGLKMKTGIVVDFRQ